MVIRQVNSRKKLLERGDLKKRYWWKGGYCWREGICGIKMAKNAAQ
jgi:hypothetical protein